jgi:hypothetical protein
MKHRRKEPEAALAPVSPLDSSLMSSKRQCTAMSKRTGERCKNFAPMGQRTCRMHGGATRKSKTAAAKRIAEASGYSADLLVEFMADPEVDVKLRAKIAQDLLSRAGYNGKTELEVELREPEWLKNMSTSIVDVAWSEVGEDVIDAEVVETTSSKSIAQRLGAKPDPMKRDAGDVDAEAVMRARADHDPEAVTNAERNSRRERFLLNRMNDAPVRRRPR